MIALGICSCKSRVRPCKSAEHLQLPSMPGCLAQGRYLWKDFAFHRCALQQQRAACKVLLLMAAWQCLLSKFVSTAKSTYKPQRDLAAAAAATTSSLPPPGFCRLGASTLCCIISGCPGCTRADSQLNMVTTGLFKVAVTMTLECMMHLFCRCWKSAAGVDGFKTDGNLPLQSHLGVCVFS